MAGCIGANSSDGYSRFRLHATLVYKFCDICALLSLSIFREISGIMGDNNADVASNSSSEGVVMDNQSVFYPPEEPQQIETGDSVKVKQVLDETTVETIIELGYRMNYSWDNIKLLIMVVSCVFAMTAQFYPLPFPDSRLLLGVCCAAYFVLSGVLQFMITFIDKKTIMSTLAQDGTPALQIDTSFERFQEYFTFAVIPLDAKGKGDEMNPKATRAKMYVGRYFTEDGFYDQVGFAREIEKVMHMYSSGIHGDVPDFEGAISAKKKKKKKSE